MSAAAIIFVISFAAFLVAFSVTDYNTGRAPAWAKYLGVASVVGCIGSIGWVFYTVAIWVIAAV